MADRQIYAQPTAFSILAEDTRPIRSQGTEPAQIALPTSPSRRGNAFEFLILSYYNSVSGLAVEEWSSCLYGQSGKLYQCDGILSDGSRRYLLEVKFFEKRPASVRDIGRQRREQAAKDLECHGIVCVSLNGFDDSVREWQQNMDALEIVLVDWKDLRPHVLSRLSGPASVLLDAFDLRGNLITSVTGSQLRMQPPQSGAPLAAFPEFIAFPDPLERWIRRLPKLSIAQHQLSSGHFLYAEADSTVRLIADRKSDLSLWEAWELEDALFGYAARVYNALKATAQAVGKCQDQPLRVIQKWLKRRGWKTGEKGIRKALDDLIILGFVSKRPVGRHVHYSLTPMGTAYVSAKDQAETIFRDRLHQWSPYRILCDAIEAGKIEPKRDAIIRYFKEQYRPYEPYARCLFNDNSADGLLSLYREFELLIEASECER
ncbi:MAG: hypothetical protein O7E52_23590 [Candidatus Poribacteria bacterium]|nr:hypothetical protein [Candidatus Poribacteria bacterium]